MNNKKIKAVIFDIGGVLELGIDSRRSESGRTLGVHEYIAKELKISIDRWFEAIDTIYSLSIIGKISKDKLLSLISKRLNLSSEKLEKIMLKAFKHHFRHNKELYEFAFNLKKLGYKIAILSDQWPVSKDAVMDQRLIKHFDVSIVSCDVGLRKPNPEIYKLVLKKLKLKPQETVFIDNQIWNIKPAEELGINAILYKNNKQTIKNLENLGVKI